MNKEITKKITSNDKLLFVGTWEGEEYYQKVDENGGWSFMGLRAKTEQELREYQRETDPQDICGISRKDFETISRWFDYDSFADDMEEDWYEHHDVQAERENEEGETLYLGFGSGQDIKGFFKEHNITDYKSYVEFFEEIGLTEGDFISKIIPLIKE